jgi:HD-like signal output (HDOD) protein
VRLFAQENQDRNRCSMLGRLLRHFGKTQETPAPPPAIRHGGTTETVESAASPAPVASGVEQREAAEVADTLKLEAHTRIESVRQTLARADRESDAPAFLDALGGEFDAIVRQPPLAAQRALSVSRDPNSSSAKLVGLVETDPGLSQGLLRYANSAFYATGGARVVSLLGAVQRVGTSGVHNVVLRSMVDGLLCRPGGAYQTIVDQVWEHMVRTAPIAQGIAGPFRVQPDEAYALGLLHDVGKLVIFDRLGELRRQLRRDVRFPAPVLSVVLRYLHEPLGGMAALQWGLGPSVAHAIATHRRSPLPEIFDRRCELLHVAEKLDLWRLAAGDAPPPLEDWWRDGAINISIEKAAQAIAALPTDTEVAAG